MAIIRDDANSNCSKNMTSASLHDGVQGSNYQPRSEGDENNEAFEDDARIPFGSSTNKTLIRSCPIGAPSLNLKVNNPP
jgi:hypothetical protein